MKNALSSMPKPAASQPKSIPIPGLAGGTNHPTLYEGAFSLAIIETVFVTDHGLDQHRYHHLRRIAKKQWQSGKPVKEEHSNQQLWRHVRRMNEDAAQKVARLMAEVCAKYPGASR